MRRTLYKQEFVYLRTIFREYELYCLENDLELEENRDVVGRMVEVLQRSHRYCVENGEECVGVLSDYASGITVENEQANWDVTTRLMSDEFSTTKGLGYFDPGRIASDYELVSKYFDIASPFDPETIYTNEFIDPEITMIEIGN